MLRASASLLGYSPETVDDCIQFAVVRAANYDTKWDDNSGVRKNVSVDSEGFDKLVRQFKLSRTETSRWSDEQFQEQRMLMELEEGRKAVLKKFPITSSANFEGRRTTRYGGYVSGDEVAVLLGGGINCRAASQNLMDV